MNLKEFLNLTLPSDKILSRKPGSINAIANKNLGSNVRKINGRSITVHNVPKPGENVKVRHGDGSELLYKVLKIIYDETGKPTHALVSLPGGGDKRRVRLNINVGGGR